MERIIAARADDAEAHYALGRTLSLEYALNLSSVIVDRQRRPTEEPPRIRSLHEQRRLGVPAQAPSPERSDVRAAVDVRRRIARATDALRHLRTAVELDDQSAAYHLAYAYCLESTAHVAAHIGLEAGVVAWRAPSDQQRTELAAYCHALGADSHLERQRAYSHVLRHLDEAISLVESCRAHPNPMMHAAARDLFEQYWLRLALLHYALALDRALSCDGTSSRSTLLGFEQWLHGLISGESALAILRIVESRGLEGMDSSPAVCAAKRAIAALGEAPASRSISPVLFSLTGAEDGLDDLLDSSRIVRFDMDGDGVVEQRPWIKPTAGLLVWLGTAVGDMEAIDGRSLFGNVTWWLLFRDGYAAMAALDDDGDGWLRERELSGIGVWSDRDGDAVPDPGEVRPIESIGVIALCVRADGAVGRSPMASRGVLLADGTSRPTYDWVCE